jgi:hypothetical protein
MIKVLSLYLALNKSGATGSGRAPHGVGSGSISTMVGTVAAVIGGVGSY